MRLFVYITLCILVQYNQQSSNDRVFDISPYANESNKLSEQTLRMERNLFPKKIVRIDMYISKEISFKRIKIVRKDPYRKEISFYVFMSLSCVWVSSGNRSLSKCWSLFHIDRFLLKRDLFFLTIFNPDKFANINCQKRPIHIKKDHSQIKCSKRLWND